jgi:glycosyltransferase XagB
LQIDIASLDCIGDNLPLVQGARDQARLAGTAQKVEAKLRRSWGWGSAVASGRAAEAIWQIEADDRRGERSARAFVPNAFVPHNRQRSVPRVGATACPEIDCVRELLPRRIIAAAEHRARSIGVGAEHVLICADALTEEAYLTALAASLGTAYVELDHVSRSDCPLDDGQLIHAAATGLLPLREGRDLVWVVAPRDFNARRLADLSTPLPAWLRRFRLTSSDELCRFVMRHSQRALGQRATDALRRTRPLFSSAPRPAAWRIGATTAGVIIAAAILALAPTSVIEALSATLCVIFLIAAALRMASAWFAPPVARKRIVPGTDLPVYTIICALYREAAVVKKLVAAIRALDYPPEKLDAKFILEADDEETRRALIELDLGPPFEIIVAPAFGPRTKPKALNVALPLARGAYTVIYDAEDEPEPDQLRLALDIFADSDPRLACVQASLTIDNTADNWLTRGIMAQAPQAFRRSRKSCYDDFRGSFRGCLSTTG